MHCRTAARCRHCSLLSWLMIRCSSLCRQPYSRNPDSNLRRNCRQIPKSCRPTRCPSKTNRRTRCWFQFDCCIWFGRLTAALHRTTTRTRKLVAVLFWIVFSSPSRPPFHNKLATPPWNRPPSFQRPAAWPAACSAYTDESLHFSCGFLLFSDRCCFCSGLTFVAGLN